MKTNTIVRCVLQAYDENGQYYYTLVDCWHPNIKDIHRCYDLYSSDFPPADEPSQNVAEVSCGG